MNRFDEKWEPSSAEALTQIRRRLAELIVIADREDLDEVAVRLRCAAHEADRTSTNRRRRSFWTFDGESRDGTPGEASSSLLVHDLTFMTSTLRKLMDGNRGLSARC